MRLRHAVLALALTGPLLTSCGTDEPATPASSPAMSRATVAATALTEADETTAATTTRPEKTVEAGGTLTGFTSPTGRIGCILDNTYVRCDVSEHTWVLPARPADCELDYGQGVGMSKGEPAALVCAGDTTLSAGPPLDYGKSVTAGALSCASAESGVTCRDANTGHGFTVARETYRIF